MEQTVDKMNAMKLTGMVEALQLQLGSSQYARMSFEDRFGLLVDSEHNAASNASSRDTYVQLSSASRLPSKTSISSTHAGSIARRYSVSAAAASFRTRTT